MWWLRHKVYLLQIIQKGLETQKTERENTSSSLFVVEKLIKPSPISLSHTYSVSFPSLSSPVWSFSWSLSAATTGSPSRPGDPPETPCRRRGSNKSDSNFKAAFTPYKLTTFTVFKFSSSVHTWVLCVTPGRPCPPHPAAWTKLLLPLCWETGASWEIYLLPRL